LKSSVKYDYSISNEKSINPLIDILSEGCKASLRKNKGVLEEIMLSMEFDSKK